MSILNVWLTPDCATVGVDTETIALNGTTGHTSKLIPLIHMNSVIACRGQLLFLTILFEICHSNPIYDLDNLLAALSENLSALFKKFLEVGGTVGIPDTPNLDGNEVIVVGWSNQLKRIIGRAYIQTNRADGFHEKEIDGRYIAPGDMTLPVRTASPEDIERLVLAQVRLTDEKAPGEAAGGRFIIADLSRDLMTIRPLFDLPAREAGKRPPAGSAHATAAADLPVVGR